MRVKSGAVLGGQICLVTVKLANRLFHFFKHLSCNDEKTKRECCFM
jgi:hypothetical protein